MRNRIQQIYLLNNIIDCRSMKLQLVYSSLPEWQITKLDYISVRSCLIASCGYEVVYLQTA